MAPTLSPPAYTVLVIYPRGVDTFSNLDYYLTSHIPLAERLWGPSGMKVRSITHYGDECAYHLSCVLEWADKEAYERAMGDAAASKEIMDDVGSGRITNSVPRFLGGVVAG